MWNRTETEIEIYLIRHGRTRSNEEKRYLGKTDEPLSDTGRAELKKWKNTGESEKMAEPFLVSSPMKRCIETAGILFGKQPDLLEENWTEIDFGRFEGRNYEELKMDKDYLLWLESAGTLPFPEGESKEAFIRRSMEGFYHVLFVMEQKNIRKLAAVVHGGTIMAVLSSLTGQEYFDFQIENGGGYNVRLVVEGTESMQEEEKTGQVATEECTVEGKAQQAAAEGRIVVKEIKRL